ncbi:magnesium transporter [Spiribacter vilamensis]|uniref:Magnesium transporter MgtE n=1 Tax=Spiribacter vilamensis TaxID=531306 RepID=A0A4Q8CY57_9GAMM|nr:magnesium transporter [Spiribacter vilamensis]RZU97874.1 magnesium transporter [Spiribacter vilamensis]TVO61208.1 magnesium transporter [Spiribacter vilamensis]
MIEEREQKQGRIAETVTELLQDGTLPEARRMLNALHPSEIANLLESFPPAQRNVLWELVDEEVDGEVLLQVNDEVRGGLIREMDDRELLAATSGMDMDDLADFMQDLPRTLTAEILHSLDNQNRQRLEAVLAYPEDSAGGLMNTDTVTVRPDVSLDVVFRYLRMRGEMPELTDHLFVVSRYDHFLGILRVSDLLTCDPAGRVEDLLVADTLVIPAEMSDRDVARMFEDRDLISAPVLDSRGRLIGRITIDDVVDVIRDEAERSILSMAGLGEEEDLFAPVWSSSKRRAGWLGLNLITALMAAYVIGLFEATIQEITALAVLMPVVASMGGIAGTQTLALVIRALALGHLATRHTRALLLKELGIGLLNGLLWAVVLAGIALLWFGRPTIGVIIAVAMTVNLGTAAASGVIVPLVLKRFGIDPALAGGVILTTVTDIVGFTAFLGLATLFLL